MEQAGSSSKGFGPHIGSSGEPWTALEKGSGRKASKKTNVATAWLAGRGGSVRSAGVKWVLNQQ